VVKTMGDGALVEFASAVDAVDCAVAVQAGMAGFNAGRALPIEFRIGVNLGDVIHEGDDILGDGVNLASRLEAQAPRNGILVSEAVHAQVRGKVSVSFEDAGELSLKNIAGAVRAWRWGEGGAALAAVPVQETPAIAVLPFTNMSNDPEQEYFSDGISEDIITDLSKVAGLMVVARNSSFVYKGRTVDIREVGRELGVTSVLEGSIRRAGNRVRITAQLIDARTGAHLWADRYDRDLTDIFAVQDEVTTQIVGALRIRLQPRDGTRLAEGRTANVAAHDAFLQGRETMEGSHRDAVAFRSALASYTRAVALDPNYSKPHAGLALAHVLDFQNHWSGTPDPLSLAARHAAVALEKGPDDPLSHAVMSIVKVWQHDLDGARASAERALDLAPNNSSALGSLGLTLVYMGEAEQAIEPIRRGIQLDPGVAHQRLHFLGLAQLMLGRYDEAVATFRERIRLSPATDLGRSFLAAALGHLGRMDEARAVWAEMMAINPQYSLDEHLGRSPFRRPEDRARIVEGLARAGLPG
jgi:adenylate cyclase